jgi:hypothetical protein
MKYKKFTYFKLFSIPEFSTKKISQNCKKLLEKYLRHSTSII